MKTNLIVFHVTQLASMVMSYLFFGWKAGLVVFLINWTINTEKYS